MTKTSIIIASMAIIFSSCGGGSRISPKDIKTEMDTVSYSLGLGYGLSIKKNNMGEIALNLDALALGVKDAMEKDSNYVVNEADLSKIINDYFNEISLKAEQGYLDKIAKEEGTVKLDNGLMYQVIEEGAGATPNMTDTVSCHYIGKLSNGEVFESSYDYKQTIDFPLNSPGIIKGWKEAIQKMRKGAKWRVIIPSEMGYGERGYRNIPPNSPLDFTIELVDIR